MTIVPYQAKFPVSWNAELAAPPSLTLYLPKGGDKEAKALLGVLTKALAVLQAGKPASTVAVTDEERPILNSLGLLTAKPVLYVCNVSEGEAATGNVEIMRAFVQLRRTPPAAPQQASQKLRTAGGGVVAIPATPDALLP